MSESLIKTTLGSRQQAERLAERMQQVVPAYQHFLQEKGIKSVSPFENLPTLNKKSYIKAYP